MPLPARESSGSQGLSGRQDPRGQPSIRCSSSLLLRCPRGYQLRAVRGGLEILLQSKISLFLIREALLVAEGIPCQLTRLLFVIHVQVCNLTTVHGTAEIQCALSFVQHNFNEQLLHGKLCGKLKGFVYPMLYEVSIEIIHFPKDEKHTRRVRLFKGNEVSAEEACGRQRSPARTPPTRCHPCFQRFLLQTQ